MPSAPSSENTPSPTSVFTPIRLAPAAPAKAPVGSASATNADPRSTTKNPTAPATTATMAPTIHALTMKPDSIAQAPASACRRAARSPGAGRAGVLGQQVADEHQRHHEEAH